MDRAKRKRLEAAGWRIGTVAEYFDLSPSEAAYLEIRIRLSNALRTRRSRQGISQTDLAAMVGSSQSRVAKMEGRDPSVTIDLLIKALIATGTSVRELSRILGFAEPEPIIVKDTNVSDEHEGSVSNFVVRPTMEASNSSSIRISLL